MSHTRLSHVTRMNESRRTYEWVMSHLWMSHNWRSMSHRPPFGGRLVHMCDIKYEWVMTHIWMRDMTRDFTHVIFKLHIWLSHVPYINESCPIYEWVMSHLWMNHVPYMNESCPIYEWVMSHIWMNHVPYMNESRIGMSHDCLSITLYSRYPQTTARDVAVFVKVCCSELQCDAVCCSVRQCVLVIAHQ